MTPVQLAVSVGRADMLGTLLQFPECVKASDANKLELLTAAVKTKDKSTMLTVINAFEWPKVEVQEEVVSDETGGTDIELKVVEKEGDGDKASPPSKFLGETSTNIWQLRFTGI